MLPTVYYDVTSTETVRLITGRKAQAGHLDFRTRAAPRRLTDSVDDDRRRIGAFVVAEARAARHNWGTELRSWCESRGGRPGWAAPGPA